MPKTQLVVVSVLQSWQPESRSVLKMLEDPDVELYKQFHWLFHKNRRRTET